MKKTIAPNTYVQSRSIGGSDAAAVMGRSRYKTAAEVYDAIVGHSAVRPTQNDRGPTERGRALEGWIIQMYERETENITFVRDRVYCEQHPFLHATPDRLILAAGRGRGDGLLEIKAPGTYVLRQWKEEGIPEEYYIQMQHYLFVLGLTWGHFCALDYDAWTVWVVPVERDEQTIAMLVDKCTTFWLDYVEAGVRPPESAVSKLIVEAKWPKGRPGAPKRRTDSAFAAAEQNLITAITNKKLAEKALDLAQDAVKALVGEDEEIIGSAVKIVWKEGTKKTFDLPAFMEAKGLAMGDVEPFYKRTATRPFNVYPIKEGKG
jgi:putative phage-type endonuclease